MTIDTLRHNTIFDPIIFKDHIVDIIGCGATGSKIAIEVAKLGVNSIRIWDNDIIEDHNIANQAYSRRHLGMLKVDALAELIEESTGIKVNKRNEKYTGQESLGEVVFLLVDTMEARKEIGDSFEMSLHTKFVIETRMGINILRIYSFDPTNDSEINKWKETLCDDSIAAESVCGSKVTVGATASMISSMATWNFIRWYQQKYLIPALIEDNQDMSKVDINTDDKIENEIIMATQPYQVIHSYW